jgi:flavorubredoxin
MNLSEVTLSNDYNKPVRIGEGIYWVGFFNEFSGFHCNPYLIIEGNEAVLIDSGSRGDFSTVMMKILETGVEPQNIGYLLYHHYDPDLCGSITCFEEIISNKSLQIVSHSDNNIFIQFYSPKSQMINIEDLNYSFTFKTGRKLTFIPTPYCHCTGSFVTYDEQSKILFSSDLFGNYSKEWELYFSLPNKCKKCEDYLAPTRSRQKCSNCIIGKIVYFNRSVMTSSKALHNAIKNIQKYDIEMIAPQHGTIIHHKEDVKYFLELFSNLDLVGIDGVLARQSNEQ